MKLLKLTIAAVLLLALACFRVRPAMAMEGAEVFDVQKGEVVKSIPHSETLQLEVLKWLNAITGGIGSLTIDPKEGTGLKVELAPPLNIHNRWVDGTVTQVVLFVSRQALYEPILLVFTRENGVTAVNIHCDGKSLGEWID